MFGDKCRGGVCQTIAQCEVEYEICYDIFMVIDYTSFKTFALQGSLEVISNLSLNPVNVVAFFVEGVSSGLFPVSFG